MEQITLYHGQTSYLRGRADKCTTAQLEYKKEAVEDVA